MYIIRMTKHNSYELAFIGKAETLEEINRIYQEQKTRYGYDLHSVLNTNGNYFIY